MKTLLQWLIVPALVVGTGYSLRAQEPGEPRKTGKVLLLKSGMVMEGDIEQIGKEVCIRRGSSEVRIAVERTVRLCPDWLDAYSFMLAHIKLDNANDRIKLARWCHTNRLNDEALEQAKAALEMQPMHPDAKQMVTMLERLRKEPQAKPVVVQVPVAPPAPRVAEPAPTVDVTSETFIAFTTKVQPILINVCAGCHATDSPGKFRLERVFESSHKVSTQRNLAAVLNYVDLDHPTISPLLVKALTPHGRDATPPLRDRSAAPFQAMQLWILDTIRKNPQLKEYRDVKNPTPLKSKPEEKPSTFSSQSSHVPMPAIDVSRPIQRVELKTPPAPEARPSQAARVRDWCDPEIFNEWAHPRAIGQQAANTGPR